MQLPSLAVKRPVTTMMVFVAIMVLGVVAYLRLPVQLIPDFSFPRVQIWANSQKSAEDNLRDVTRKIEGIAAEMPRVKTITSQTASGWCSIHLEFEYGTDIQYTLVDLQERLESFQKSTNDPRLIINAMPFDTADFQRNYMWLSVVGPGDTQALFETASQKVEQQLRSIDGVSSVEISGLPGDTMEVRLDTDLLASYGLDVQQVVSRVQAAASQDIFLGELRAPEGRQYVRLNERLKNAKDLGDVQVDAKGIVRLRDVSAIAPPSAENKTNISRRNGGNSISIEMQREAGRNLIELAQATRKRVAEINATLPPGVVLEIREDLAKYVEEAISQVRNLAMAGALLALLVPLAFFRSARVSAVVFVTVPVSLIAVFNLFGAFNMSINILSILGLGLGVGMLVDSSIVVTENAFRLHRLGFDAKESAARGGVEVQRGLLASTLTSVIVFLPMVFQSSEWTQVVKEAALALVFPLLTALVVSLTLVPVLISFVLRTYKEVAPDPHGRGRMVLDAYRWLVKSSIRHRGALLFIIAAVVAFTWLESYESLSKKATSSEPKRSFIWFNFDINAGSTITDADRSVRMLEKRLSELQTIKGYNVWFNKENGNAWVELKPREERANKESYTEVRESLFEKIGPVPGLALSWYRQQDEMAARSSINLGAQESLVLKGLSDEVIRPHAERVIEALRSVPGVTNAAMGSKPQEPAYLAVIDREKARLYGIRSSQMGQYAGVTRRGGTVSTVMLEDGDRRTNIAFTIPETESGTLEDIKNLAVLSATAGRIPFGEMVTMQRSAVAGWIQRVDRQQSLSVVYYYSPKTDVPELRKLVRDTISRLPNPGGVVIEAEGEARKVEQREKDFAFLLLSGILLVYVVMAAVFESYWVPFTILATSPLMLVGIVWGLKLASLPLDDYAYFGILLLVGLAVNNGIVMMDRALDLQRRGHGRARAVMEACMTRLRPVMMTYLTTVLGLLPMAIVGEEEDQWRPLAVVIIGGMTSATLLTLVVLPCFYLIGDDFMAWARPPARRFFAVLLETVEGITNLAFHPIRTFRRQLPFMPSFRSVARAATRFAWELLRTPPRLLWALPGDLWQILRFAFGFVEPSRRSLRRREREEAGETRPPGRLRRLGGWLLRMILLPFRYRPFRWLNRPAAWLWSKRPWRPIEVPPAEVAEVADPSPLSMSNLHVIYPPTGLRWIAAHVPERFKPARLRGHAGFHALNGVTMTMEHGIFGVLGPNGAGKTTMLRCLAGLLEPTRGTVRLFGVANRHAREQVAPLIGYLPQNHGLYEEMSLYDYLNYFSTLMARTLLRARAAGQGNALLTRQLGRLTNLHDPVERHRAILNAAAEVNLSEFLHQRLGTFSGGMKQRAGIARILLQGPPILIVDEPTAGLDPIERIRIRLLLSRLAETRLVIFSTHIVEDLEKSCEALCLMDQGRLLFHGTPAELKAAWEGKIWDVPAGEPLAPAARTLYRLVREGVEAERQVSRQAPTAKAVAVSPTLEDALLAVLGVRKGRG